MLVLQSLLFTSAELRAQSGSHRPIYNLVNIQTVGDSVDVSFTLFVPKKALKRNYTMTIRPLLSDGVYQQTLPLVKVTTRYSSLLERKHSLFNKKTTPIYCASYSMMRGDSLNYRHRLAYSSWMSKGVSLINRTTLKGCCGQVEKPAVALLENIALIQTHSDHHLASVSQAADSTNNSTAVATLTNTTNNADSVTSISANKQTETLITANPLSIQFNLGSSKIDTIQQNNFETLQSLRQPILNATLSPNAVLEKVVIIGSASIEGNSRNNMKLSQQRAESLRQYIIRFSTIDSTRLALEYQGEDWIGLYELIQKSDMKHKKELLHIIDNEPNLDRREYQVKKLRQGAPYRYIQKYFFPLSRKAGYILFYYKKEQ